MKIAPKNWNEFQHYKDRDPPWIKLHKKLLDNFEFHRLPLASRALAPMLWLLASEAENGVIDARSELIAFRIRASAKEVEAALKPLIDSGFFVVEQVDSVTLAERNRHAMPETYKQETETPLSAAPTRRRKDPEETSGFLAFWSAWPKSPRKSDRFKCFEVWRRESLEALGSEIIAHVERMKRHPQWLAGFDPAPLRYLRNRRWTDPVDVDNQGGMSRELVA